MPNDLSDRVQGLWQSGTSIPTIAATFGVTRGVVAGIIHRGRKNEGEERWPRKQKPRPSKTNGSDAA